MSETLRSYSGSKRGLSFGAARRGGRGVLPGALLLFMLGVFVAAFWISRDTHDIDEFLQADRPVQVRIEHAINSRNTLAESPVWAVLPGNSTGNVRAALREPPRDGPRVVARAVVHDHALEVRQRLALDAGQGRPQLRCRIPARKQHRDAHLNAGRPPRRCCDAPRGRAPRGPSPRPARRR